jgi:hypothetical protein
LRCGKPRKAVESARTALQQFWSKYLRTKGFSAASTNKSLREEKSGRGGKLRIFQGRICVVREAVPLWQGARIGTRQSLFHVEHESAYWPSHQISTWDRREFCSTWNTQANVSLLKKPMTGTGGYSARSISGFNLRVESVQCPHRVHSRIRSFSATV